MINHEVHNDKESKIHGFRRFLKPEYIIPFAIFLYLVYILIIPPIIGKGDNGDFGRTLRIIGLLTSNDYHVFSPNFTTVLYPANLLLLWGFDITSVVFVAKIGLVINEFFQHSASFDIRALSILYICIFCFGIHLILKYLKFRNNWIKWVLGILIMLVFTDAAYISYFNSFFGEAASTAFTFLFIGSAICLLNTESQSKWKYVLFFVSTIFFLTAKSQNIPLLVLTMFIFARIYFMQRNTEKKPFSRLIVSCTVIAVLICGVFYVSIGHVTNICNKYQTLFYGVLKDSPHPEEDLDYFGIDRKYAALKDTVFFENKGIIDPLDEKYNAEIYDKISYANVSFYYLTHLPRLAQKIKESADNSFVYFPIVKENFANQSIPGNKLFNTIRTGLSVKYAYLFHNLYIMWGFTLLALLVLLRYRLKEKIQSKKILTEFFIMIVVFGFAQYFLPILGSGAGDLAKHMFALGLFYDIMIIASITWVIYQLANVFKGGKVREQSF